MGLSSANRVELERNWVFLFVSWLIHSSRGWAAYEREQLSLGILADNHGALATLARLP